MISWALSSSAVLAYKVRSALTATGTPSHDLKLVCIALSGEPGRRWSFAVRLGQNFNIYATLAALLEPE